MDVAQEAPDTVILAQDECWMYLQATTMAVWSPRGQTPVVGVDPGRSKAGFYGTVDLHSGAELVMRSGKFNATMTSQHLLQMLEAYPERPILLLWDRAPWHRGESIRKLLAANSRLEIVEFPVGAPELNPQEQVWKQTRRAVGHNHLTPRLPELADRFENHLTSHTFASSFLDHYGYHLVCPFMN